MSDQDTTVYVNDLSEQQDRIWMMTSGTHKGRQLPRQNAYRRAEGIWTKSTPIASCSVKGIEAKYLKFVAVLKETVTQLAMFTLVRTGTPSLAQMPPIKFCAPFSEETKD